MASVDLPPGPSSATPVKASVCGCGSFAVGTIWPCLHYASIEVDFAFSRTAAKAERARAMFGAHRATTNLDDVLSSDSTAVFVVGPPQMHYEVGLRALEAGKHVFLEKSPADTLPHARELAAAATRLGLQCQVGFQKRYATGYRLAAQSASDSAFGGVRLCKINYSHWLRPSWEDHLFNMSVHPLDLARFFLGDPSDAVVLKRTDSDSRHICVVIFTYETGATAVVTMSSNEPHVQEWVELSGANQLISVTNLVDFRCWSQADNPTASSQANSNTVTMWQPQFAIPKTPADSLWLQGYAAEIQAFAEAIRTGQAVTPSIDDGVVAMELATSILEAPEGFSRWQPASRDAVLSSL